MARAAVRITKSGGPEPEGSFPAAISVSVITPIVFCASFVPCASDTIEADTTWPCRKVLLTVSCRARRTNVYTAYVPTIATAPAISGGCHGRDHDRLHDLVEMHRAAARGDPGRPDQPAEQGVRRAGRQPGQPGQQVPQDRADQATEDDRRGDLRIVDDAAGDGLRDRGG